MDPKKYKDVVYKIIGAAMEVHNELNWGLLEAVYNEALYLELFDQGKFYAFKIGPSHGFGPSQVQIVFH